MGVTALVLGAITLAASVGTFFLFSQQQNTNESGAKPPSFEDLKATISSEGSTIPELYGENRTGGNIIWMDHFITEPIFEESGGGKGIGGGSSKIVTGYNCYVDVWISIGMGQLELIEIYINGKKKAPRYSQQIYNDGTSATFPNVNSSANVKKGTAWIYWKRLFLGENVRSMPSFNFVTKRILPTTIDFANMDDGNNPAAIIYHMLSVYKIESKANLQKFQAAAAYYNNKNYALSLPFSEKGKLFKSIEKIMGYVGGIFYIDRDGRYSINPLDPNDSPKFLITKDSFSGFVYTQGEQENIKNSVQGTYIEPETEYSKAGVQEKVESSIYLYGLRNETIDLNAFTSNDAAQRRASEIVTRSSYAIPTIEFGTSLAFAGMERGDLVQVSNDEFGISNQLYRITAYSPQGVEVNEIGWQAEKAVEVLWNEEFNTKPQRESNFNSVELSVLSNIRVFELPYTETFGENPTFVILAARETQETGYNVLFSTNGSDYKNIAVLGDFAQHGTLDAEYSSGTFTIDDEEGILYTPTREDPEFATISRQNLFIDNRVAIVGNEVMAFEQVIPEGVSSIRLLGVRRGLFNTPVETHAAGSDIYLTRIGSNNTIQGILNSSFFLKIVPFFLNESLDETLPPAIAVTGTGKASKPWPISRIKATKTGGNVELLIYPSSREFPNTGAGMRPPSQVDAFPFNFAGDFEVVRDTTTTFEDNNPNIVVVAPVDITVRHRIAGLYSDSKTVSVGATDGEYFA